MVYNADKEWHIKPGRKKGWRDRAPSAPTQKTVRLSTELIMACEERALKESLVMGTLITFTDLVRRGLADVLASPEPVLAKRSECNIVNGAHGVVVCITCKATATDTTPIFCPRTGAPT